MGCITLSGTSAKASGMFRLGWSANSLLCRTRKRNACDHNGAKGRDMSGRIMAPTLQPSLAVNTTTIVHVPQLQHPLGQHYQFIALDRVLYSGQSERTSDF